MSERNLPERGKRYLVSALKSTLAPRFVVEVVDAASHGVIVLERPNGNFRMSVSERDWERMNPVQLRAATAEVAKKGE